MCCLKLLHEFSFQEGQMWILIPPFSLGILLRFSFTHPASGGRRALISIKSTYRSVYLWGGNHYIPPGSTLRMWSFHIKIFSRLDMPQPRLRMLQWKCSLCEWSPHSENWPQKNGNHSENLLVTGKMRVISTKSPQVSGMVLSFTTLRCKSWSLQQTFPLIWWKCLVSLAFFPTSPCFQILFLLSAEESTGCVMF